MRPPPKESSFDRYSNLMNRIPASRFEDSSRACTCSRERENWDSSVIEEISNSSVCLTHINTQTYTYARMSLVTECNPRPRAIFLQTATKFHCVYFLLADLGRRSKWLFMRTTEGCCDVDYLSFCLSFWLNRI